MACSAQLIRLGLTGGIGAGKSTVAAHWRTRGLPGVDADELAHRTLLPGTATYAAILKEFGTGILNADRTISRSALAAEVFGNEPRRAVLNGIIHPVVRERWHAAVAEFAAAGNVPAVVVSVPLLFEVGLEKEFDFVVVVACSAATQMARLSAKGMSGAQAQARIAAQWPMPRKMGRADWVIWNDGSPRVMAEQADMVWERIKEESHAATRPTL